jgi:DNA-binding MarR family transcriptional regulator
MNHKSDAMVELALTAIRLYFRMRKMGRGLGAVSAEGAGVWGTLRELCREGPKTVPALARARPVSRQYMQRVVDGLQADGLVRLQKNPAHKRSPLIVPTEKGRLRYEGLEKRIKAALSKRAERMTDSDLSAGLTALKKLAAILG